MKNVVLVSLVLLVACSSNKNEEQPVTNEEVPSSMASNFETWKKAG